MNKGAIIQWIFNILVLIALGVGGFFMSCQNRQIKMSPIEKMFEKNPELASYALCQRTAAVKGHQGGVNVRDCDVFKNSWEKSGEYKRCIEAMGGVVYKGLEYSPKQIQNIANAKAACYLTVYKQKAKFVEWQYKICRPNKDRQ